MGNLAVAAVAFHVLLVKLSVAVKKRVVPMVSPEIRMAPLLQELSCLEVEPLEIVEHAPGREGFYFVRSQDSSLDTLTTTPGAVEAVALLTGKGAFPVNDHPCCCCCSLPCLCCPG